MSESGTPSPVDDFKWVERGPNWYEVAHASGAPQFGSTRENSTLTMAADWHAEQAKRKPITE